jgi:uncharacterized membrane protein (UPF0182 family)
VQPLYLQSDQTKLPQLQRVIVFYRAPASTPVGAATGSARQVVAMEPTLGEALVAAFGESFSSGNAAGGGQANGGGGTTGGGTTGGGTGAAGGLSPEARTLIARANQEFDAAQEALKAGDFAEYGNRIKALEQALTELQRLQQQ